MNNPTAFQTASDELRALGLVLQKAPGQYRVNFRQGTETTEYLTDDLETALAQGRKMAAQPPPPAEPPLGPTGPRRSNRGKMYRHNRKIAARRRRQQSAKEKR